MVEDLARQFARTRRFRLGAPGNFSIVDSGRFVTYLRDGSLWVFDTQDQCERRVGPASSYSIGSAAKVALLDRSAVSVADLRTGDHRELPVQDADDAGIAPDGNSVAFVRDRALHLIDSDGTNQRTVAMPDGDDVTWALPEYAAWMSMERDRGFWWSPDSRQLLVARVDESKVQLRYLADATDPTAPPRPIRYPAAGTANAEVTLHLIDLDGRRQQVEWDREQFEYVVRVSWTASKPLVVVQTRDQQRVQVLEVDPSSGVTALLEEFSDPQWVDVWTGTPSQTAAGELVWIGRDVEADTYRLMVDGKFVTPPGLQVADVQTVSGETITFIAQTEPTEVHVYQYDGSEVRRLTHEPGVHGGRSVDGTTVIDTRTFAGRRITVNGHALPSVEEEPVVDLRIELVRAGESELRTAVFRPSWHEPGSSKLPVLLNPYAGPGFQLVLAYRSPYYYVSQWFAEQGFIVLSTDGRGTPGRGPAFERVTWGNILEPALDDQIEALHAVAARDGDLDLDRVALRGWSYSGFLAAGAVLHRPDVFHAGIAGAAPTDQRQYDTYWKERYLGHPDVYPEAYRRCSLLPYADKLTRPLLIEHGLADTNVWSSHALRFSKALTTAGKPHDLIVLPGEGHAPSDEDTIVNLLQLELAFLQRSL